MCRKSKSCTELDPNPKKWSRTCPLQPPKYFDRSLNIFVKAYKAAESGDIDRAKSLLGKTQSEQLRNWYVDHGQMSGWHHRVKALKKPKLKKYSGSLEKNKSFAKFESQVYKRDGYICRYCSIRVIDTKALLQMEKIVGRKYFRVKGTNEQRHGVALVLRATIDHIKPLTRGGRTKLNNLVTSCWSCNYGKLNATLDQLGLANPLDRAVRAKSGWNGLMGAK